MDNKFLAIDKRYFGTGLRSLDLLIVAHIEEFQRNGCECHLTNQQFCEMFGEDINAVKRSIKKLEDMGIITRCTTFIKDNGRSNRQRKLNINHQWKAQCEPTIAEWKAHSEPSIGMKGSDNADGRLKNGEWMAHSEPIKDKEKIIKDNVLKAHNEPTICPEEKDGVSEAGTVGSPAKKTFVSGDGLPGRRIRDLSQQEANEIKLKLRDGVRYLDIENEYGMRHGAITAKFEEHWRMFVVAKASGRV